MHAPHRLNNTCVMLSSLSVLFCFSSTLSSFRHQHTHTFFSSSEFSLPLITVGKSPPPPSCPQRTSLIPFTKQPAFLAHSNRVNNTHTHTHTHTQSRRLPSPGQAQPCVRSLECVPEPTSLVLCSLELGAWACDGDDDEIIATMSITSC